MTWDGSLSLSNFLLVLFYLAIIAIGIGAAWMRLRWIGLTPLAFSVGYSLANGIGRFSGWRYDLPADWISYFYFGLGVAEILWQLVMLFGAMRVEMVPPTSHDTAPVSIRSHPLSLTFAPIIVFMLVGALPWIVEGLTEPRFTEQTSEKLVVKLSDSSSVQRLGVNGDQIESFVKAPQTTLQIGYILYPRFFTRNLGMASSHPWPAYAPREFPRLGFVLINQSRYDEVFPSRNSPDLFPSAADAIVLGCQHTDYIEVRLILFPNSNTSYLSSPLTVPCN